VGHLHRFNQILSSSVKCTLPWQIFPPNSKRKVPTYFFLVNICIKAENVSSCHYSINVYRDFFFRDVAALILRMADMGLHRRYGYHCTNADGNGRELFDVSEKYIRLVVFRFKINDPQKICQNVINTPLSLEESIW